MSELQCYTLPYNQSEWGPGDDKLQKDKKQTNIIIKVVHATRALYSKSAEVIALCEENRHLI